ncbi:UDP-N-acetylmuramoyl-tripeptide--D-alanyl-D-alanine ligase [Variovorax boronicumulans]|uniref:Mur ligase family protein n=1 Tax=Variovorax boronicumulans TaxID=436515 RepID=UPI003396AC1A
MSLSDLLGSAWQGLHSASNPDETHAAEGLEDCLVFFAWSDGTTQARVLSGRGKDLETAWAQGAQALEAQATGVPRDLRVDWVRRVRPLRWTAFKDGLGIPAAEGLAFDARCESALLAPQVDSQRRRLLNAPTDDDTTVWAFQTRAVHVDASGVHILAADGLRELQPFDVPLLRRLVAGGADHLAARVQTDGALAPSTPDADAPRAADHAHAVHALLEAWDPAQAETRQAAIHRALARLTRTLIRPAALPNGTHVACLVEPGSSDTSLGANAACIGALVRYTELSRDRRYLPLLDQLARTVLHMQDPICGRFAHALHHPSMAEKAEAPGDAREDDQAIVALLRLYALTGNRRWFGAVEKAFEHFVAASYANAQDHALCRATSAFVRYRPEPRHFQFGLQNLHASLDFALAQTTAVAALPALLAAGAELVARLDANPAQQPLLDGLDRTALHRALLHSMQRLAASHAGPERAMFFAQPAAVEGSFFGDTAQALADAMACLKQMQSPAGAPLRDEAVAEAVRTAARQPLVDAVLDAVPRDVRFTHPLTLGPLRLLGARVRPREMTGPGPLTVETWWQADAPVDTDWRLDIGTRPATCVTAPAWGLSTGHAPCQGRHPVSRWTPGKVYRDVHVLRPPLATRLYDVDMQMEAGLISPDGRRVERLRMPRFFDFVVQEGKASPAPTWRYPAVPRYRVVAPASLPPDQPGEPRQTWNAAQIEAVTGGTWHVAPPPGWFIRSLTRGEGHTPLVPPPTMFVASDYWTLATHERFGDNEGERNWDWSESVARMQPTLAGAVLRKPVPGLAPDFPVLLVDDPIQALVELGIAARERLQGKVIGITGSAGKTSVCHMLDHAFAPTHTRFATIDNYNSRVGMLSMLANTPAQTDLVILEVAVSAINAVDYQNIKRVRPDLAVLTNITASHLGEGETVMDVARRKANIFEGMQPGAWAVICTDTDHFDYLVERARARELRVLTYGSAASADFRLDAHDPATGHVRASRPHSDGQRFEYTLGAKGRHMAVNSLVCFAVAHALSLDSGRVPEQLASFAAVKGRGQELSFTLDHRRFRVIDESYNANPLSMTAALASLAEQPDEQGRKLLVLGDMKELGDDTQRHHDALVEPIVQCHPARVFLLGECMTRLHDRLAVALPQGATVQAFDTLEALERALLEQVATDDTVLFKSSNGTGLWQIVRNMTELQEEEKEKELQQQARRARERAAAPKPPVLPPMPQPPAVVIRRAGSPAESAQPTPSWVLYDFTHDRLLTHQPSEHSFVPASLSKLVTAALVEQKLRDDRLDRHAEAVRVPVDPVPAHDDPSATLYAADAPPLPVHRLLEAALVVSSNKAALTLASWHSGDFDSFVAAMNRQAQAWGMHDTHFACPAGLVRTARTTAVDMLTMARHVLRDFPSVLEMAGKDRLDGVPAEAPSTNLLLGRVPGVDGLKTGSLPGLGSHLIATAQRDQRRLVSVVLGAPDRQTCARLSALLLQRGFETPAAPGLQ